jgi:prolyl-tRNA editing enzyme YbaK/EbsC (Cys-tRNA(Pro) deacylase)
MAVSQFNEFLTNKEVTDIVVVETDGNTHTAQQAADVHGVPVSNIVKSLLTFVQIGCEIRYVLVLVPGDKRLDIDYWKDYLEAETLRMAKANEVKDVTGYSIGGVPPFGHLKKIETYIADGFDAKTDLVAAAGSAKAVFRTSLKRLNELINV